MDTDIITGLYEAVQAGHWFAVVGLAATLITTALKRYTPVIVDRLPGSNRWIPIVIALALSTGVAASEAAGDAERFGWLTLVGGLEAAIMAIGIYHSVKPRKPKDSDDEAGDQAPPTPNNTGTPPGPLVAALVLALCLPGCAALGWGSPVLSADEARVVSVAHAGLDAVASDLAGSTTSSKALGHLQDAQVALDLVDAALTESRDAGDDLKDAITALELAAAVLSREGVDLPEELGQALLLARLALAARG